MKKVMPESIEKEFVEMIVEFARKNKLTIRNIKKYMKLACKEMEKNAVL